MTNYCREFIIGYATIAGPLFALLKGVKKSSNRGVSFGEKEKISFEELKTKIALNTTRSRPNKNYTFILATTHPIMESAQFITER
jgi:hypothetical protein